MTAARFGRSAWRQVSGGRSQTGRGGGDVPPERICRGLVRPDHRPKVELPTDAVVRTASAEEYSAGQRLYGNVEGDLLWTFDKAAAGQPLQSHMWARLRRV